MRRREERRQPAVGRFRGQLDVLRAERRHVDRQVRPERLVEQLQALGEVKDLSFVHKPVALEDLPDDLDRLAGSLERPVVGNAVPALDHLWAAHADTEDESAARQLVERGRRPGEHRRRPCVDVGDVRAQLDPLGFARDLRKRREGVEAVQLRAPDRVIAEVLGAACQRDQRGAVSHLGVRELDA